MMKLDFKKFLKGAGLGALILLVCALSFWYQEGQLRGKILGTAIAEGNITCSSNSYSTGFVVKNDSTETRHLACIEKRGSNNSSGCACPGQPDGKCDVGHIVRWDKRLAPGEQEMCAYSSLPSDCGVFQMDVIEEVPDGSGNWTGAVGNCWYITNNCQGDWRARCNPVPTATLVPPTQTPVPTATILPPSCQIEIVGEPDCTNSLTVNLSLSSAGATEMEVWNQGSDEGSWHPYQTAMAGWILNGWSPVSRVWARFRNAGGYSDYCSAAISYPCATATSTNTPLPTNTPHPSLTPTLTPTITQTPMPTNTLHPSITPTVTPTITSTPTSTPTGTLIPTATNTPTVTSTPTSTPVPGSSFCEFLEVSPSSGQAPLAVRFRGKGSDSERIKAFRFVFGDGQSEEFTGSFLSSHVQEVDHIFQNSGTYHAFLEVVDNGDHTRRSEACEVTISISGPPTVLGVQAPPVLPKTGFSSFGLIIVGVAGVVIKFLPLFF